MSETESLTAATPPGRYRASTPWSPFAAGAAVVAILLAALGLIAVLVAAQLIGLAPEEVQRWMVGNLMALFGALQLAVVLLTVWVAGWFGANRARVLALGPGVPGIGTFAWALGGMALLLAPYNALVYVLSPNSMVGDLKPFADMLRTVDWWLLAVVIGLGAPLSEELLFRGFLLSALSQSRIGYAGAALITTAIWTVLHAGYSIAGLLEVFLIGLYFCWVLWRTGSLWVPIFCHAFYNTLLLTLLKTVGLPST